MIQYNKIQYNDDPASGPVFWKPNGPQRLVCLPGYVARTVHTFNSCTSQPDVCQCLVLQTTWVTSQRN